MTRGWILILLGVALGLRCYRIHYGLPALYDPDEVIPVTSAGSMLAHLSLNPHWFGHPASTLIYLLCLIYGLGYGVGHWLGYFPDPAYFRAWYDWDPSFFYLSGRLLCACIGAVSILPLYFIGKKLWGKSAGLIAAFGLALCPEHLSLSRELRCDVLLTLLILAIAVVCIQLATLRRWQEYALAGFLAGLATATKYPGIIAMVMIFVAHGNPFRQQARSGMKLGIAGLSCLIGIFVGSPFLLPEFRSAWAELGPEGWSPHLGMVGAGWSSNLWWYLSGSVERSLGGLGSLIALFGGLSLFRSPIAGTKILVIFPLVFLGALSLLPLHWERWALPVLPFGYLWFCAGWLAVEARVRKQASEKWAGRSWAWSVFLPVIVLSLWLIPSQWRLLQQRSGEDTRAQAARWILQNIPVGSRLLMEWYAPELPKDIFRYYANELTVIPACLDPRKRNYRPTNIVGRLEDISSLFRLGVEYVVLSDLWDRQRETASSTDFSQNSISSYQQIDRIGTKVYEVRAVPGRNQGPSIRIYHLPSSPPLAKN